MLTALQEIRKPISSRREEDESLHVEINGAAKDETSTGTLRIETLLTPGSALFGVRLHQLGSLALACLFCRPSGLVLSLSSVSQRAQIIIQHQPRHRQQDKQKRPPITTQGYTTRLLAASHAVYSTAITTTPCPCRVSRRLFSLSLSQPTLPTTLPLPPPPQQQQQQPGAASVTLCTPPLTLPTDSHTFVTSFTLPLYTLSFSRITLGLDT
jgi:hypothetical protein